MVGGIPHIWICHEDRDGASFETIQTSDRALVTQGLCLSSNTGPPTTHFYIILRHVSQFLAGLIWNMSFQTMGENENTSSEFFRIFFCHSSRAEEKVPSGNQTWQWKVPGL